MRKKLVAVGNSTGVVIDQPLLQLMGASEGDEIRLEVQGHRLVIEAIEAEAEARRDEAAHTMLRAHRDTLEALDR